MKPLQTTKAQRLVAELDAEIRSRGRGAIRAVDRAAGYSEGWWQHRVASGDITVQQLLKVLSHLGLDPTSFIRRAIGSTDHLELNRPDGPPPEMVRRAWKRLGSNEPTAGIGQIYLDTLDQRRYQEPEEVVRQALWAVNHVELDFLPQLLGVAGSAWRALFQPREAEHAIQAGISIAQQQGRRSVVARLLQRLAYVAADHGDHEEAMRITEKAAVLFLRFGQHVAMAKATVDIGKWLHNLGRFEESNETHQAALALLPEHAHLNRCAAHQYLGLNSRELGDFPTALAELELAEQICVEADIASAVHSKLCWFRARVNVDLGNFAVAEELLISVVEAYRNRHLGETVVATCELVRVQLLRSRPLLAYETAMSMRVLVEPLKHNRIVSAALADLLRSGQAGLTLSLISSVVNRLEAERQNTVVWHQLQTV